MQGTRKWFVECLVQVQIANDSLKRFLVTPKEQSLIYTQLLKVNESLLGNIRLRVINNDTYEEYLSVMFEVPSFHVDPNEVTPQLF